MTCTLGDYAVTYSQFFQTTLFFSDGNSTNVYGAGYVFDEPQAPRIFSIEGCGGATSTIGDAVTLRGCKLGDIVTLYGREFYRPPPFTWGGVSGTRVLDWSIDATFYCVNVTVLSNSSVTCALPTLNEWDDMQPLQVYPVIIYDPLGDPEARRTGSNAFKVSFGTDAAPSTADRGSSSSAALIASLATVLSLVALLGVMGGIYWTVRRRGSSQSGTSSSDESGVWSQYESSTVSLKYGRMQHPVGAEAVELSNKEQSCEMLCN